MTSPRSGRFTRPAKHPAKADVVHHRNLGSLPHRPFMEHSGASRVPGRNMIWLGDLAGQGYTLFGVYRAFGNGSKAEQYSRPRVESSPEPYGDGSIVLNKGPQHLNK